LIISVKREQITLDKYEYKIRSDEIKNLIAGGEFVQAAEIADTIDWRRVKSVMMLCTISDLYKINRRYEDAKNMLLLAYERKPGSRTICYSLCELCIKTGEFVQAVNYYKEFVQVAPKDSGRYILQYKLYEAQEVSLEERISVLEELKKKDYREKWAYELAYLYHRVGLATRCVEECDELILWFGDGKYVVKAMELKMLHQPLTPDQQEKYDHRFDQAEQEEAEENDQAEARTEYRNEGDYGQDGYDRPKADGQEDRYGRPKAGGQGGRYDRPQADSQWDGYGRPKGNGQWGSYGQPQGNGQWDNYGQQTDGQYAGNGQESAGSGAEEERDEPEIQVKTIDVGQYNTINLQAELAAGLQEVLGAAELKDETDMSETEDAEACFGEDGEIRKPGQEDAEEEDYRADPEHTEESSHEDTEIAEAEDGEQEDGVDAGNVSVDGDEDKILYTSDSRNVINGEERKAEIEIPLENDEKVFEEEELPVRDDTAEIVLTQMRLESISKSAGNAKVLSGAGAGGDTMSGQTLKNNLTGNSVSDMAFSQPPKELADVLSLEADGQIGMVMPESVVIEKQITGQMKLEDILAEWERTKKDNEEKCKEDVRKHVMQETGSMFTEFEAAVRDGLLERLEKGEPVDEKLLQMPEEPLEPLEEEILQEPLEEVLTEEAEEAWEEALDEEAEKHRRPGARYAEPKPDRETRKTAVMDMVSGAEETPGGCGRQEKADRMSGAEMPAAGDKPECAEMSSGYAVNGAEVTISGAEAAGTKMPSGNAENAVAEMPISGAEAAGAKVPSGNAENAVAEVLVSGAEAAGAKVPSGNAENAVAEMSASGAESVRAEMPVDNIASVDTEMPEKADGWSTSSETSGVSEAEEDTNVLEENIPRHDGRTEAYSGPAAAEEISGDTASAEEVSGDTASAEGMPGDTASVEEVSGDTAAAEKMSGNTAAVETAQALFGEETAPEKAPKTVKGIQQLPTVESAEEAPIERDVAKVRGLTREEKELFAPFIQSRSARENLVKMVDNISMAAYTGNVVITGEEGMDTMTFAKNVIRELQMMDSNFSGKVAKISGQGLNQRNIEETLWHLNNGALIIYRASGMNPDTASMLHQQLQQESLGIVVVLEDTKKAIQRMFLGTPELFGDFTARMDLEALSNDTLVSFGRRYAREMEYSIDDLGVLALHTRIEELQTIDHVVTVVEVKKIVDEAIRHACRKTLGHFFDILLARRYDEEDMIILTEKDFA